MSRAHKHELLAFVQDVVSVGIPHDFQNGAISNADRVQFGIYQVALRHINLFRDGRDEREARLASKHVNEAVKTYFGQTVRPQSVGDWKYKNGTYHGYYELFEQLGVEQIKRVQVRGVGYSRLTADVGYVDSMASSDADHDVIAKVRLTLKPVITHGKHHYILLAYKILTPRH